MNKKIISIFCMLLIITTPLTLAAFSETDLNPSTILSGTYGKQDLGEAIVVNVGGYEPRVIQSSSIESGTGVVYVYLQGTTFGTLASTITGKSQPDLATGLTNIPPIKSMIIQPDKESLKYLSSPPKYFKPVKNAFSLNNLGQVVLNLKQIPKEEDVPEKIDLNFTATITFDLEQGSIFGISQQGLILKPHPIEAEWLEIPDSQKDRFFAGRGYIRLMSTTGKARFMVYDKYLNIVNIAENAIAPQLSTTDLTKEATVSLSPGEVSQPIILGSTGDLFLDSFRIRLNQIIEPQDKAYARLTVYGNTYDTVLIRNKPIYPGSSWKVYNIYIREIQEGKKSTGISVENFLNYIKTKFGYTVTAEDLELPKSISSVYTTTHVLELENRNGDRAIIKTIFAAQDEDGNQNLLDQISKPITESEAESILSKYCPAAITKNPPPDISAEKVKLHQSYYACNSIEDNKEVMDEFPSIIRANGEAQSNEAAFKIGEVFFNKEIPYNGESRYFSDMRKLALYFYAKVPDTSEYFLRTQEKIDLLTTTIGGSSFLPDESVGIDLKRVQLLTQQDKPNAEIIVGSRISSRLPKKYFEGDLLTDELTNQPLIGIDSSGEYNWMIEEVSSKSVVFRKKYTAGTGLTGSQTTAIVNEEILLPTKTILTEKEESIYVKIERINSNVEADVTILPGIGEAFSTSSFQIHLPIDKRLFKFSKEQLEDQIKKTQKLIEKLDNTIEKLDKLVVALKKTCLVVSTALIVKNSFFIGAARNVARKEIMKVYDEKCRSEISQGLNRGKYVSQDGCYQYYSPDIESALDEGESSVDTALKEYKEKTQKKDGKYTDKEFNNYLIAGGTPDDYKTYLIYKELSEKEIFNSEDQKYFEANKKLIDAQIPYDRKISQIATAQKIIDDINKKRKEENKEPLSPIETEKEMRFIINALENQKVIGTGLSADAPLELSNVRDIKNTNEFEALIPSGNEKTPLTRLDLIAPSLLALKMKEAGSNTEEDYRKKLINDHLTLQTNTASATQIANEEIEKYRVARATNNYGNPIFIPKESYDSIKGIIISDPKAYYTSNIFPFEGGQSIRDDYIEQTSYRSGGTITAQFTTDGYVYCYPIGQGDYTLVNNWFKTGLPDLSSTFIYNVGSNGKMECGKGDDVLRTTPQALAIDRKLYTRITSILNRVGQCRNSGEKVGSLSGTGMQVLCSFDQARLNEAGTAVKCTDTMDPNECKLLFNFCDPVMCPASRCNLGGRWKVDDVIGSGLIGSTVLCWPNRKDGVMIPVCLTGISAGLRNIRTILQGYQSCLETSLKEGRNVGLCDYIRSIGMCEILWKEALFMVGAKGGVMDWALSKVSPNSGGEEYTRFRQSFDQASKSFNYFTTEYSQSLLAQYKGKSFQEIGSTVCKLAVNGKIPNLGDVVDQLSQPEDPPQFTAVFDETIDVTEAGITPYGRPSEAQSYYRGFYHIYAGKGYSGAQLAPTGYQDYVQYSVYLKSTTKPLPVLFVTKAGAGAGALQTLQSQIVRSSTIKRGEFVQQSINARGESGYDQICVVINGKTSCGFGKASSAFGMKALQDSIVYDEANRGIIGKEITTSEECRPDYPRTSPSLGSLTMPQQFGMLNTGIIRVCNPTPPGPEDIWRPVGDCGNDKNNKYLGKCWLNVESIKLNDAEKAGKLATDIEQKSRTLTGVRDLIIPVDESRFSLAQLDRKRIQLIDDLKNFWNGFKEEKKDLGKILKQEEPTEPIEPNIIIPPGKEIQKGTQFVIPKESIKDGVEGGCRFDGAFNYNKYNFDDIHGDIKGFLNALPRGTDIYIYGFASTEGKEKANTKLSQNRANTIKGLAESLSVKTAIGKGETDQFSKEIPKPEEISPNRRYIVSTSPISKFIKAPELYTPFNCEATIAIEQVKYQASFNEYNDLKFITGTFYPDEYHYVVNILGDGEELIQTYDSQNEMTISETQIKIISNVIKNKKDIQTIHIMEFEETGSTPKYKERRKMILQSNNNFITGKILAVRANGDHIQEPQPKAPLPQPKITPVEDEVWEDFNLEDDEGKLKIGTQIKVAGDEKTYIITGFDEPLSVISDGEKITKSLIVKYKEDISQSEKPLPEEISPKEEISDDFKVEVLETARQSYDSFNQLKTEPTKTIDGEELITKEYSYEELIKFSADAGTTAEALLQRAEFYEKLAMFIYELIGEKPEVPLKPQTPVIKAKFTADTANKVIINGDFDFKNYDYFISITDNNNKKIYINADTDKDGITYGDKSIILGDKYNYLAGNNVKSILITVYFKGTSEYPLTFIELNSENNFGKEIPKEQKKTEKEFTKSMPYILTYLNPGVKVTGKFDTNNFYYLIDFDLIQPSTYKEELEDKKGTEIIEEEPATNVLGWLLKTENNYNVYFNDDTKVLTITGDFSNNDAEVIIAGPADTVSYKKQDYGDLYTNNKFTIKFGTPSALGIKNKEDMGEVRAFSGKYDTPELDYLPEEELATTNAILDVTGKATTLQPITEKDFASKRGDASLKWCPISKSNEIYTNKDLNKCPTEKRTVNYLIGKGNLIPKEGIDPKLITLLNNLQNEIGKKIIIESGVRDVIHNKWSWAKYESDKYNAINSNSNLEFHAGEDRVSINSWHMCGYAADFRIEGWNTDDSFNEYENIVKSLKNKYTGYFNAYKSHEGRDPDNYHMSPYIHADLKGGANCKIAENDYIDVNSYKKEITTQSETIPNRITYDSVTNKENFKETYFETRDSRLEENAIENTKLSIYKRTQDTIGAIESNQVANKAEEIRKVASLDKTYDLKEVSSVDYSKMSFKVNKKEDIDPCAKCKTSMIDGCSQQECNDISSSSGKVCTFNSGIFKDQCVGYLIAVDAGHGAGKGLSRDPGAAAKGNQEINVNLKLADYLANELEAKGYTTVRTRSSYYNTEFNLNPEVKPYLLKNGATNGRGVWANEVGADLFVSAHNNAAGSNTPILYPSGGVPAYEGKNHCGGKAEKRCDESKELATYIKDSMNENYKPSDYTYDRKYTLAIGYLRRSYIAPGTKRLGVFSGSKIVSTIIEFRPIDDKALRNENELKNMAAAAAIGIDEYIKNNREEIFEANDILRKWIIGYPEEEEQEYDNADYEESPEIIEDFNNDYNEILFDDNKFYVKVVSAKSLFNKDSASFNEYVDKLKAQGAIAVINAGFFDTSNKPIGVFIDNNIITHNEVVYETKDKSKEATQLTENEKSKIIHRGLFIIKQDGSLAIDNILNFGNYALLKVGAKFGDVKYLVQGYLYVINGKKYESTDLTKVAIRNSIAIQCKNNDFLILQSKSGVNSDKMRDKILEYGCKNAVGLDGGGSVSLYYNGKTYKSTDRSLPNVLAVFPKEVYTNSKIEEPKPDASKGTGFSFIVLSDVHEDQTGDLNEILNSINQGLSNKPLEYVIINGDLIMKNKIKCDKTTGDLNKDLACYKEWYNKINKKTDSLNAKLLITPGNHDYPESLDYYKEGIQAQTDETALITLNYKTRNKYKTELDNYDKVFVFSHVPFVDHKGAKEPNMDLKDDFIEELKDLNGKCVLISGHSHVYATKTEPKTGCLGIGDGVAGGDQRGQKASYTLVEVYPKGFKVCQISQDDGFKFNEERCTSRIFSTN